MWKKCILSILKSHIVIAHELLIEHLKCEPKHLCAKNSAKDNYIHTQKKCILNILKSNIKTITT